ncbi:MAG: BolA family protein [Pseudomonadota bacterium]
MGVIAETIEQKLTAAFAPEALDIVDQSHLHKGHAGAPDGGESHFRVRIVSAAFDGQNRVARQRAVNAALKDELAGPVHAMSVQALAPGEA